MTYAPPTDLDRLAAAWAKLQAAVNGTLPNMAARVRLAQRRMGTGTYPPPKPPS